MLADDQALTRTASQQRHPRVHPENLQDLLRAGKNRGDMNTSPSDTCGAAKLVAQTLRPFWRPASSKFARQCAAAEYALSTKLAYR